MDDDTFLATAASRSRPVDPDRLPLPATAS
jgi:hypothetical protein